MRPPHVPQSLTLPGLLQFWDRSNRLRDGALVCLLSNSAQPSMIFATINMREPARSKALKHSNSRFHIDPDLQCCHCHYFRLHSAL